jgi:hypothetical protein
MQPKEAEEKNEKDKVDEVLLSILNADKGESLEKKIHSHLKFESTKRPEEVYDLAMKNLVGGIRAGTKKEVKESAEAELTRLMQSAMEQNVRRTLRSIVGKLVTNTNTNMKKVLKDFVEDCIHRINRLKQGIGEDKTDRNRTKLRQWQINYILAKAGVDTNGSILKAVKAKEGNVWDSTIENKHSEDLKDSLYGRGLPLVRFDMTDKFQLFADSVDSSNKGYNAMLKYLHILDDIVLDNMQQ